ncbi:MAG: SusC/RagA family TonB-linked outer membrane protein [Bacteroidetes bacterium]|nr:SusC/RagA family TonB-linked outer membrane protein [Bacteroidota bacterium]
MRLTAILLLAAFLQVSANGLSQGITLNLKKASLEKVMAELERQSGYHFLYTKNELDKSAKVDVTVSDVDLVTALAACFRDQPFEYSVVDSNIVLRMEPRASPGLLENFFRLFGAFPPSGMIRGKVVNDQGRPLEDAAVMIKGGRKAVYTNKDGIFSLQAYTGAVLEISYPGYTSMEFTLTTLERPASLDKVLPAGIRFLAVMQPSHNGLDEMQVIAYGKISKRFNTGSVTTIKAEDIAKNPVNNVLEALQGRVPGMLITQASGNPGSNFTVQIRGQSSFGVNSPLFVIDGVVYPAGQALPLINPALNTYDATKFSSLNGGNALNYFDPSLIESVEILKDADATSIYGSRGAYGVVLITTKKGKPGSPRLNVNAYSGISEKGVTPQLMNTQQYLQMRREAFKNDGATPGAGDYDLNGKWDTTRYTDWDHYFIGHGATSAIAANYSGGAGTTSYLVGGNFTRLNSINRGGGAQNSGGLNFNINTGSLNQKFSASFTGNFSTTVNDMLPVDFFGVGSLLSPNHPALYLPNGQIDWSDITGATSPVAKRNAIYHGVTNNLTGTTLLKYNPLRGLSINATIGYNLLTTRELNAYPSTYVNPLIYTTPNQQAQSRLATSSNSTVNFDPYANYNVRIGGKGRLDVTAGMDMQSSQYYTTSIGGQNFVTDATIRNPALGLNVTSAYNTIPNRQLGYFGRVNYLWDEKYGINLTGRYDGSTKFGPGKQFGAFGAIGALWIFTQEKWVRQHLGFLSFGKIRGSYGTTGGDGIGNYSYLTTYNVSTNGYQGGVSVVPNGLANPYLQWETNKKKDLGLELHFLRDRIWVETDYYENRTSNQLIGLPLSIVTGFGSITQNSPALIQNKGFEGQLTTINLQGKLFSWKTGFNISVNRNKLLAYPGATPGSAIRNNPNYVLGKSLQNNKLFKYAGVDPATGLYFFTNAKGVTGPFTPLISTGLTQDDRTENVDLQPSYFGGIENTITYRGFTLDFFFSFTRRKGPSQLGQQLLIPGPIDFVPGTLWLDRWRKPGDHALLPKVTQNGVYALLQQSNFTQSTGAYENATYARLQNVYISYSFQSSFLKRSKIAGLTVYIKGQNLLTISKYRNLDPENLAAGATGPLRVYTGGINITL